MHKAAERAATERKPDPRAGLQAEQHGPGEPEHLERELRTEGRDITTVRDLPQQGAAAREQPAGTVGPFPGGVVR